MSYKPRSYIRLNKRTLLAKPPSRNNNSQWSSTECNSPFSPFVLSASGDTLLCSVAVFSCCEVAVRLVSDATSVCECSQINAQ